MKTSIITTILFLPFLAGNSFAQTTSSSSPILDTIFANDSKNVALFFPAPIRQGITGAENFVFTYNREQEQHFGLLQARPGEESNLLIINCDGAVFSYIVRYKKQLSKLNYFIPRSQSIGNEKPVLKKTEPKDSISEKAKNRDLYHKKFSEFLLDRNQKIGRIKKRGDGILLSVQNIVYDRDEMYFVIEIENSSSLDYDLNFLKFYIETKKQGKRKSIQRLEQKPIYIHQLPVKIPENETRKMVFVLSKFSLANDKRLVVALNERNGERNLKLNVKARIINNPN